MTISKKPSWNLIVTLVSIIFAAGTAWGVSKVDIEKNADRISVVEKDLGDHIERAESQISNLQYRLERKIEVITKEQAEQRLLLERVATDIQWMKNNQQPIK